MRIAKVIKARCAVTNNYFGIRIEQKLPELWESTWAFPIKENMQVTETYHQERIGGVFKKGSTYPGCPHCRQMGFFQCQCNKISCIDFTKRSHTCPWCNNVVPMEYIRPSDRNVELGAGSM